jgi:SAM-dependent methyltransferase
MTPLMRTPEQPEEQRRTLQNMIRGFRLSQMISVAAKLRIADRLTDAPKSVSQLAREVCCHDDSLYRLLRALASVEIFAEEDGSRFRLTPMAQLLRSDVPDSLRGIAEASGEAWTWLPWGSLLHSVKTGETAFENVFAKNTWDWFDDNPAAGALFDRSMDEITASEARAIVQAYDFGDAHSIVDIAGGRGVLLAEILRRHLSVRGILFNLPHVVEAAKSFLDGEVKARIEFASGNFFQAVPAGGDLYILKNILHDWDDNAAQAILANCRRALKRDARLLIIEHIVESANAGSAGKIGDISMMVRTGGRNRTEQEFRDLLGKGGFYLSRIIWTASGPAAIEALMEA